MKNVEALIRARRSVRTFEDRPLEKEHREKLESYLGAVRNPYGLEIEYRLLDGTQHGLSTPVSPGAKIYVAGKMQKTPHCNQAFGYAFEEMVLFAQSLGVGTVWIGGTMDRGRFEKAMNLGPEEIMPCVSPLGYAAKKMNLREIMMRKGIGADSRMAFEKLFFDGDFEHPLSPEKAGDMRIPLEMVRLAPSAVNRQPWRVVKREKALHFYLKRAKGFGGGALDMQKIDMGIALCHFDLTARGRGINMEFCLDDPGIETEKDMEYIATYKG